MKSCSYKVKSCNYKVGGQERKSTVFFPDHPLCYRICAEIGEGSTAYFKSSRISLCLCSTMSVQ